MKYKITDAMYTDCSNRVVYSIVIKVVLNHMGNSHTGIYIVTRYFVLH
jgi:hypothetical protein